MKILHINCNYIGTKLYRHMIEHLSPLGIESTVYTPVCEKENEDVTTQGCQVIVSKCFRKWHRFLFDYKQHRIIRDLQQKCDIGAYDRLHAYTLFTDGNCAYRMSRKYHVPFVVTIQGTDINAFFKRAFYLRGRGVRILRAASAVIFYSENHRKRVLEEYVPARFRQEIYDKSHVIPSGIEDFWLKNKYADKPTDLTESLSEKKLRVLSVGVIYPRKNHMAVQEALRILRQDGWQTDYCIVGKVLDQPLFERIMAYPGTRHIPPQPKEELIRYYRESDVFVLPSHMETFGLVYPEAISQGLPVIYTKGQGFEGQTEEGSVGFAADDKDPAEIARRILDVTEQYGKLVQGCLEQADRFDWDGICAYYSELYENISK